MFQGEVFWVVLQYDTILEDLTAPVFRVSQNYSIEFMGI
jgi:hypothetical protein